MKVFHAYRMMGFGDEVSDVCATATESFKKSTISGNETRGEKDGKRDSELALSGPKTAPADSIHVHVPFFHILDDLELSRMISRKRKW